MENPCRSARERREAGSGGTPGALAAGALAAISTAQQADAIKRINPKNHRSFTLVSPRAIAFVILSNSTSIQFYVDPILQLTPKATLFYARFS